MHMSDALLSPSVGGIMWAATALTFGYCSRKIKKGFDDSTIPLMGVLGAFVFVAQMINFTIPGTGSSGHIGGGLLLAILLGPHAAFLTIASVLIVQALFFADGGLLALGANIFNLGFFPCFIAFSFIYKKTIHKSNNPKYVSFITIITAMIGLQMGAAAVVCETILSGVSSLSFQTFLLMVLPIHLAIGLGEGLITAGLVTFIAKARPELFEKAMQKQPVDALPVKQMMAIFAVLIIVTGGLLSWYASEKPDGLEWAIAKASGGKELQPPDEKMHATLVAIQEKTAILPDYAFKQEEGVNEAVTDQTNWGAPSPETSIAGLVGGAFTLVVALFFGFILRKRVPDSTH